MSSRLLTILVSAAALASAIPGQTISPSSLPSIRVGLSYNQTLTFSPPDPGTSWSLVSGNLPPGLNLTVMAGDAIISGQATQTGAYSFLIGATPPGVPQVTAVYTIIVSPMGITPTALPDGAIGAPYAQPMTALGGFPGYTWAFAAGTVANGLSIDPTTGLITGVPLVAGLFPINVTVTDSGKPQNTTTRSYIWVVAGPPAINTSSLPAGELGIAYSQTLAASSGTPPYVWSLASGSTLPPGLMLNSASGLLYGMPTSAGSYPFTVQIVDSLQATAMRSLSITVQAALTITTTFLPAGNVDSPYSQTLQSSGGVAPITWAVTSGTLPPDLTLNSATGVISGPPISQNSLAFTVTATDSLGATASVPLTLQITALSITSSSLPDGAQNVPYTTTLIATGGTGLTWTVPPESLPIGLMLDADSGAITGTPTQLGTFSFAITVVSTVPTATATNQFSITIAAAPPVPASITLTVPGTPGPAQQPTVAATLGSDYPLGIAGTVTLTFAAEGSDADNPEVRFTNGTRMGTFTFAPNTITATFPGGLAIITGTVGGTITLTSHLTDSAGRNVTPAATPVQTIVISQGVPVITSVRIVSVSGGFNFIVTGYSTTREVSSGLFHFTPIGGNTLATSDFTIPLTSAFTTWYNNPQSANTGSQFTLTMPFQVQGATFPIATGTAQLTNARGVSAVSPSAGP